MEAADGLASMAYFAAGHQHGSEIGIRAGQVINSQLHLAGLHLDISDVMRSELRVLF